MDTSASVPLTPGIQTAPSSPTEPINTTGPIVVTTTTSPNTTNATTATVSSTTNTSSCHGTYSVTTAAGIGVGSAFAGALVAVSTCFIWLMIRRNFPHRRKSRSIFSHAVKPTITTLPSALERLEDTFPQALTHAELAKEVSQLETAIRNYLDNYIDWDGSPTLPPLYDDRLNDLAGGTKIDWNRKLYSKASRSVTLRMFVARFLASRIDVNGVPGSTLLPSEVMRTYQTIMTGKRKSRTGPATYHTWRSMTAYLVSNEYPSDRASLAPSHGLQESVNREAIVIKEALAPLRCNRRDTEDRETDVLRDLVAKAALLGLHMFSQRNVTELFWSQKTEVFPGLRQRPLLPGAMDGASWVIIREPQL